ncbi:MAG: ribonuclease III [Alphaproteobacteria bacterium]|nr:ribonuclease III [Alphaproteobacteria bacterium]
MLDELAALLDHDFKNLAVLNEAVTHGSIGAKKPNYERLEFLGDRVLSLVIADMLLRRFPQETEGDLARRHAALVRREALADVARELRLGVYIILGRSEIDAGGRDNPGILADVCEAIIAALYLDGGLDVSARWIRRHWDAQMALPSEPPKDAKTTLQEWAQSLGMPPPTYTVVSRSGPDHAPVFEISVTVDGHPTRGGEGLSKRAAEQKAAAALLELVGNEE